MASHSIRFFRFSSHLAATSAFAASAHAADLTWNGAVNSNWSTSDSNWTGSTWNNGTPDNAIFNTNAGSINLTENITAGSFIFGNSGSNTSGAFSGSNLTINGNLTALAYNQNGPGGPTLSFSNNVNVGGDLIIGRRVVEIAGGTFTANLVLSGDSWGRLLISGGTVTVANGIDDSINGGNTMNVFLQGGSLYTSYIKTTTAGFAGLPSDGVVLNGGTLYATANSSDFIQSHDPTGGAWGTRNDIGVGTSNINTNGFNITINKSMVNYGGAGTLTKSGAGTLRLTAYNQYTGGTTVDQGTLELAGATGGWGVLRGAVTVNSGATLAITGGDGTGFGWNNPVTSLTVNGGTFDSAGGAHVGFGAYMTVSLSNGGTIMGNGQWNGDGLLGFSSSGDSTNTLNGSWVLRSDNGANHTFNVANGAAAVDLQVNANLSDQSPEVWWVSASNLVKTGSGTMVLAGNSSYDGATLVSAGTLLVTGALGNSAVSVNGGAFGGTGTVGSNLTIASGSFHVVDLLNALDVTGTVSLYAGFGIDDLAGLDWGSVADGTYTLINGTLGSGIFGALANNSLATAYDLGGGRSAYLQEGSLQLVVIPEPRAALIGGLGLLALLRRRRTV